MDFQHTMFQETICTRAEIALFKKRVGPGSEQAAWSKNLCNGPDKVRIRPE